MLPVGDLVLRERGGYGQGWDPLLGTQGDRQHAIFNADFVYSAKLEALSKAQPNLQGAKWPRDSA